MKYRGVLWREELGWIGVCPELDVQYTGEYDDTKEDAIRGLTALCEKKIYETDFGMPICIEYAEVWIDITCPCMEPECTN